MVKNEILAVDVVTEEEMESCGTSLLSAEQEVALAGKIAEGGEAAIQARNELIEANLKLVTFFAKRFVGTGVDFEDLVSMGNIGLINAAQKFDANRGTRFSTYAGKWILQAIMRGIANEGSTVRIPVHVKSIMYRIKKAERELSLTLGTDPTVEEIAEYLNLPVQKVQDVMVHTYHMVSMETTVDEDGKTTLEDFCQDENAKDPCAEVVSSDLREAIRSAMDKLEPKEALVLKLRNGFVGNHPMTLDEIASLPEFGVTRERIRQIEKRALAKIRRSYSTMENLREYAC